MLNKNVVSDILPSDHLGVQIRDIFLRKVGTTDRSTIGLATIDVTELYNLFVSEIEAKHNSLYKQSNTMLFCFIIEYLIISKTHSNLLYYLDGTVKQFGFQIEDIHLEHIEMFIRANKIPFVTNTNAREELESIRASGILDYILAEFVKLLRPYGLSWDDIATKQETSILPLEWCKIVKDPALEPSGNIFAYRNKYPYDIELKIIIGVLKLDDLKLLTPEALENAILYTLDPLQGDYNMENILCNKEI